MSADLKIKIKTEDVGKRLDLVLSKHFSELSRSRIKLLFEQGLIDVDGIPLQKLGLLAKLGQEIVLKIPEIKKLELVPMDVAIEILFEDKELAVLEKPAGISVHPSSTENSATVVHGLLKKLKTLSSIGGIERPGIVHRIDKGTSGILVVSKTDSAHAHLSQQFKAHSIDRKYKTLIYGKPRFNNQRIETFFGRNPSNRKKMTSKLKSGKKAITHYKLLETIGSQFSLLECKLETGRTHQIRVHLSESALSIVGDPVYGENLRKAKMLSKISPILSEACLKLDHQLLHAAFLGFTHPVTLKRMEFKSDLPEDFEKILKLGREF